METYNTINRAKLRVPIIRGKTIRREKINRKFEHLTDCRLILITAPAGFGKTTAAVSYLSTAGIPFTWFSIDEGDNDPVRFWRYMVSAVFGDRPDGMDNIPLSRDLIASNIYADLIIDRLSGDTGKRVLVLDDYHLIHDEIVLKSVAYFIRYMPSDYTVIILGRMQPDGRLLDLCIKERGCMLDSSDLSFSLEETSRFFDSRDFELTGKELQEMQKCTEGWALGLVAAALAMERSPGGNADLRPCVEGNGQLGRFLNDQIFNIWTDEEKHFLMRTSILEKFNVPLCRAVTGLKDSRKKLEEFIEHNSFVIPLGNGWFRYHHLFAEFLRSALEREEPDASEELYMKAGRWYQKSGFFPESIEALIKGRCFKEAMNLLEDEYWVMTDNGEFSTLYKWLGDIPEKYYENNVNMCVLYSWVSSMEGNLRKSEEWTDKAAFYDERMNRQRKDDRARRLSKAIVAIARNDIALRHMNVEDNIRYCIEAGGYEIKEQIPVGEMNLDQPSILKTVYGYYGRLRDMDRIMPVCQRCLTPAFGKYSAYGKVLTIELLYERSRLDEANDLLAREFENVLAADIPGAVVPCFITLAKIRRAQGDWSGALRAVTQGKNKLDCRNNPYWSYLYDLFIAELYLRRQDVDSAEKRTDLSRIGVYGQISATREFEYLVYARYLFVKGCHEDAVLLLSRMEALAENEGRLGSRIEILCLMAIVLFYKNNVTKAVSTLDRALRLGQCEGYVRTFADESNAMAAVISAYLRRRGGAEDGELRIYADSLLRLIRSEQESRRFLGHSIPLDFSVSPVKLTKREKRILRLLAAGASNAGIADTLNISIRTVKFHDSNLFRKLGVKNHVDALYAARKLGLID